MTDKGIPVFKGLAGDFDQNTYVLERDYRSLERQLSAAHRRGAIEAAEKLERMEHEKADDLRKEASKPCHRPAWRKILHSRAYECDMSAARIRAYRDKLKNEGEWE